MKKVFLSLVLLLGVVGLASASERVYSSPSDANGVHLQRSDYGGYDYSISTFSAQASTACVVCQGVFTGVNFTTSVVGAMDFVDVFDATSTDKAVLNSPAYIGRVYNTAFSTGFATTQANIYSGFASFGRPAHFKNGLIVKPNVATYNVITTIFWALPKEP